MNELPLGSTPPSTPEKLNNPVSKSVPPSKPKSTSDPVKKKSEAKADLDIRTPMLNPAWATEAVKALGFGGPIANDVATYIAAEIEESLSKYASREKLAKLARAAIDKHLG